MEFDFKRQRPVLNSFTLAKCFECEYTLAYDAIIHARVIELNVTGNVRPPGPFFV